ncbi:hypothetical protein AWC38_SpisGene19369, partial [Stylophora pistillata]
GCSEVPELSVCNKPGCSKLPELSVCNKPEGDCSCQNGLSCVLTKNVIEHGIENPIKQCMPRDTDIKVETIDLDNQAADAPMRVRRWLYFNDVHKCGCADGLECKETAYITLPITGTRLSLRQCMDA